MVEAILERKGTDGVSKLKIKTSISILIIGMAVLFPQIVHSIMGIKGGMVLLPMYMPVVLGGCLLGSSWGMVVGILSPVVSYMITSVGGDAMPVADRLPFMVVELAIFALISGLFSKKIYDKPVYAVFAVIVSAIVARGTFLLSAVLLENVLPISAMAVFSQVKMGIGGVLLQIITVPVIVNIIVHIAKNKENK